MRVSCRHFIQTCQLFTHLSFCSFLSRPPSISTHTYTFMCTYAYLVFLNHLSLVGEHQASLPWDTSAHIRTRTFSFINIVQLSKPRNLTWLTILKLSSDSNFINSLNNVPYCHFPLLALNPILDHVLLLRVSF